MHLFSLEKIELYEIKYSIEKMDREKFFSLFLVTLELREDTGQKKVLLYNVKLWNSLPQESVMATKLG